MKRNSRSIKIQPQQYRLLEGYILTVRPQLNNSDIDLLIVRKSTSVRMNYFMTSFYKRVQKHNLLFHSSNQIRASVICNWLKSYNLREVQYMAGHRYVSSTEKYVQANVADLQKQLDELHPLG